MGFVGSGGALAAGQIMYNPPARRPLRGEVGNATPHNPKVQGSNPDPRKWIGKRSEFSGDSEQTNKAGCPTKFGPAPRHSRFPRVSPSALW